MNFRQASDPEKPVIVLVRHDLRVSDNGAVAAAAASGKPVVPVFIFETVGPRLRPLGAARHWWLHHSLIALEKSYADLGIKLILRRGAHNAIVSGLIDETGADMVLWNRRYDPSAIETDTELKAELNANGIACSSFSGHLMHEPSQMKTGTGGPYRVYTPFWKAFNAAGEPPVPHETPAALRPYGCTPESDDLASWQLVPRNPDWSGGLAEAWTPGEDGARQSLDRFLNGPVDGYKELRDHPGTKATSRLSPHLANGEITPSQIWHAVAANPSAGSSEDRETFRKELVWREFSYHLLFHNGDLPTHNFNRQFDTFGWIQSGDALARWQKGQTGYPIVDAGMRELWQTGWMHNRVRMITASFLIKHLMVDWREGERWFWDTLVDADPASNAASWQWVAGSGADAAPYFRIFNPVLQGEKFDSDGSYVRRYVPELRGAPVNRIHIPRERTTCASDHTEATNGYPEPIIDHRFARERALNAYKAMRGEA